MYKDKLRIFLEEYYKKDIKKKECKYLKEDNLSKLFKEYQKKRKPKKI